MILELYGSDNNSKLPQNSVSSVNWPCDLQAGIFDSLRKYGVTRNMMYCPANPDQNIDVLWYYAGGSIHEIGYAMTFPNAPGLLYTNINASFIQQRFPFGPIITLPASASKRVLLADATISLHGDINTKNRALNHYTGITGGAVLPNSTPALLRTSHLDGALPTGGNVGMLDGHVEWRKFNDMIPRDDPAAPATTPQFWW
jgi:prepilin-type processing-associated H-X9-DG protein